MSLKRDVEGMVRQKMPSKKERSNGEVVTSGLRKRPDFEQIVNYLSYGQEHVRYPDREAKFIRNHPYMTQLDFFEMQDQQKKAWEEQVKDKEAEDIADETKQSKALVKATQDQGSQVETVASKTIDDMAEHADRVCEHELDQNATKDKNKKESNAQTNSFLLNKRTSDPGARDQPIPTAPHKPEEYEEVEQPGGSRDPKLIRIRRRIPVRNGTGVDGERIPEVIFNGVRGAASVAGRVGSAIWQKVPALRSTGEYDSNTADPQHLHSMNEQQRIGEMRERMLREIENAAAKKAFENHGNGDRIPASNPYRNYGGDQFEENNAHLGQVTSRWAHKVGDRVADAGSRIAGHVVPHIMAANREFVLI